MKAISLKQPWAWLMVNGFKDIENRDRRTNFRGTILVHAGKSIDEDCYAFVHMTFPAIRRLMPLVRDLPRGGIVGQFDIIDCVDNSLSPWFFGPWGYVVRDPKPLSLVACRGSITIPFDVPSWTLTPQGPAIGYTQGERI
jgi:hypothetical protein